MPHRSALRLDPDKTRVGDCRQPGQGFEFLGYRFEAGSRTLRPKNMTAFKDKVRAKTGRSRGDSLGRIVADLNPFLFKVLDGVIRRRLRAVLRKQDKRPSMGHSAADHRRWGNARRSRGG